MRLRSFIFFEAGEIFCFLIFLGSEKSILFLQLWFACRLVAAAKCVCFCALGYSTFIVHLTEESRCFISCNVAKMSVSFGKSANTNFLKSPL